MTTKIIYIADDGEEFETSKECLEYEAVLDSSDCLVIFDERMNELKDKDQEWNMMHATYLYILEVEKARKFLDWTYREYGYQVPHDIYNNGLFAYDEKEDRWYDLNERINVLVSSRDFIMKQVKKEE